MEYRPARAEEIGDGLSLVLGTPSAPAGHEQVAEFVKFASARGLEVRDLWVAGVEGRMEWAALPLVSPGRTVLLLTPGGLPKNLDIGPLVEGVCRWAADKGVHLAQTLVDPADGMAKQAMAALRFREIADLLYLHVNAARGLAAPPAPDGFAWHTYTADNHDLFARAISESYRDSLDCPALNGLRTIEDVIAGHRASGEFDPETWYVLTESDKPAAVLLLTRVPRSDMAELVYLGLSPASRGRGIGDLMVRQALWAVRQKLNLPRLTLAVDSRNVPALKLYYRHGMQQMGTKTAMLRDLRVAGAPAP
jgi:ribosomal protein S18 acetylase RimI-like enzyme